MERLWKSFALSETQKCNGLTYQHFHGIVSPEAYPYPTALKFISMAKEVLGTEKIIWGTDSPCVMTKFKYADLYNFIIESDVFTEKELEMVFYHNAVEAYYLG